MYRSIVRLPSLILQFLCLLYGGRNSFKWKASEVTARIGAFARQFQHPNSKPYSILYTVSSRQLPHKFFGNCILQKFIESSQVSHSKLILSVFISRNQLDKVHEKVIVSCQHSHSKLLIFVEKDTASYQFSFYAASYQYLFLAARLLKVE